MMIKDIRSEYQANKILQESVDSGKKTGAQWMKPARNAKRFKKQSLFTKFVTFISIFKRG